MRRRLAIVALFLLAGAVVNVGVAWEGARWSWDHRQPISRVVIADSPGWKHSSYVRLGVEDDRLFAGLASSGPEVPVGVYAIRELLSDVGVAITSLADGEFWFARRLRCGWPLTCLRASCRYGQPAEFERWTPPERQKYYERCWQGALLLGWRTPFNNQPRVLPLRPLWPGFIANTVFYATLVWLPTCPFVLRRFLRVRRGLCVKCAYPMSETAVCSECGTELPARA